MEIFNMVSPAMYKSKRPNPKRKSFAG